MPTRKKILWGAQPLKSFRASSKAPIADFRGRRHPLRKAMRCGRHPHGDRLPESWECEKSRRRNFPMIGMTPLAYSGVAKAGGGESKKDQLVRCSVSRCALANGLICRFVDVFTLRERSIGDEHIAFDIAKPFQCKLISGARHCDRPVRTPAALIGGALGDDLDEKDIGFRGPIANKFADATKIGIFRFCALGCDRKLDLVGALATNLGRLSTPLPGYSRTNRGRRIIACGRASWWRFRRRSGRLSCN